MTYTQRLLEEVKRIVRHTDGDIGISARPLGRDKVRVIIKAGKNYVFDVSRYEDD